MPSRSRKQEIFHKSGGLPETFLLQINQEQELQALLQLIEKESRRLLEAEGVSVFLLDRKECELWFPLPVSGKVLRLDARLGIAGACVATGELINVKDVQSDARFFSGIDAQIKQQTQTLLALPIRDRTGDIIGVFEAVNKNGKDFTAQDEIVAQALVDGIAIPLQKFHLVEQLQRERERLQQENAHLWKEVEGQFSTKKLMGNSLPMQRLIRVIDQVRDSSVDVLITGENGTGKELVAKAIHYSSPRARQPFVAINCAALPETLIESELFGISKGTATDVEARIGKFEQANKGTLFLDEIGDLGISAQAKVLRVLQERAVEPVGKREAIPLDIRIIAATNKNLEAAIKAGTFRDDLYYRLKVVHVHTPALRDVPADIPLLVNYFLDLYSSQMHRPRKKLSTKAMQRFMEYSWPGNIRQLENEIKRLMVMVRGTTINEDVLEEGIRCPVQMTGGTIDPKGRSLHQAVDELEQRMIKETLLACRFNQVQTAKRLGLSRQGLIKKIKRHNIQVNHLRDEVYESP
ncbi:MAG: sigma-54-dependent Fis family transcriptional regulator [Nitrospirales bacterium]|nr:sigma-54-dependent Fis family transcriptional regulator [Nitrospirales bacterium]MDR4485030.1 sigma-54-dependent Fis family transcriptional regulator [Nitrospirales bacterium]